MELAKITAQQVLILFLLIGLGVISVKCGVLQLEWKKAFSNLLVFLVIPAMLIDSYLTEFDWEVFSNLLQAFALGAILLLLGLAITMILSIKAKGRDWQVVRFACIFSNAGYMGFPLIKALYGSAGVFYASAFLSVFNILLWTVGYSMMSGKIKAKEILRSVCTTPAMTAVAVGLVIYLLQIPVPDIIKQPIEMVGNMNTAISMIITGMIIAGTDFKVLMRNRLLFFVIAVRMFVIPVVCIGLFVLLGIHGTVAAIVLLLEAAPTAAITSVFAVQFGHDENLAAGAVVVTTFVSMITLPLCALFLTIFV